MESKHQKQTELEMLIHDGLREPDGAGYIKPLFDPSKKYPKGKEWWKKDV